MASAGTDAATAVRREVAFVGEVDALQELVAKLGTSQRLTPRRLEEMVSSINDIVRTGKGGGGMGMPSPPVGLGSWVFPRFVVLLPMSAASGLVGGPCLARFDPRLGRGGVREAYQRNRRPLFPH